METEAEPPAELVGNAQQIGGRLDADPELAAQIIDGSSMGGGQTNEQSNVLGAAALNPDFVDLGRMIRHETANPVRVIGGGDVAAALYGIHEIAAARRIERGNLFDFRQGGHVEINDAG